MTECPIKFPAIGFGPYDLAKPKPGEEELDGFGDQDDFELVGAGRGRERETLHIIGSDYRGWRVANATFTRARSWWAQALWSLLGGQRYRGNFEFVEAEPMTLDQVKARVFAAMDHDPLRFVDDELIAGESGEPIEEEVLLNAVKAKVMAARDIDEICEAAGLY